MLSKISVKRPVTVIMVFLMVVMGGILGMTGLSLDMFPEMDIPVAVVATTYVGAGPEEIESLITKPIEEAVGTVSNVDQITSTSSSNSSMVIIQFNDGTDIDMASLDIREKVDLVKGSLPEDANDPMVLKLDITAMTSIMVGIESEKYDLAELNSFVDDNVVNKFERIDGVASVSLSGGLEDEIQIIVDPSRLQTYGLTTSSIAQMLSAENLNYPAGQLHQGETKLQVRTMAEFKSIDEIKDLLLTTGTGAKVRLSDVADISLTQKDRNSFVLINGQPSVMLTIQKQSTANTVDISDKVNKVMSDVHKQYPELEMIMLSDTADYIKLSINNIVQTAVLAAVIAVVILFIFLRDPKMSLVIGVSIPTSILATFGLMYIYGMTMNMISMSGIAIGIGMLVDNSVVVLENIFKYWKEGVPKKEAAERGAREVGMAVTASTLTTVAVFIPLMFVKGTTGQLFRDLSLTVSFALVCSLVVSLTFVPMMCSQILKGDGTEEVERKRTLFNKILDVWGRGFEKLDNGYRILLDKSLVNKKKVMIIVVIAFIGTLSLLPRMGFDFMPEMDEGMASISIELPSGTVIEETEKIVDEVLSRIDATPEIETIYASVGGGGVSLSGSSTDSASIMMLLVDKEERERSTKDVVKELKQKLEGIAGCEINVEASSMAMGSMGGSGVSFNLTGDDTDTLRQVSFDIEELLAQIPGVQEVDNSAGESIPEANVTINREKAATYGVTAAQIGSALNAAISGSVATQYKVDGDEIDIRIKQSSDEVKYINDLKNLTITTSTGATIPITEVADINIEDGALSISRSNMQKYITLSATVEGRSTSEVQEDLQVMLDKYIFPEGYGYEFTGNLESMIESFQSLMLVFIVALCLVYMIMASQFESLIYPFLVMFSVPLAITGAIFGLFITGNTITVTSFMGFIMLVGMVVNNAIVLIDATNQIVAKGEKDAYHALLEAGPSRLRPILMTTLTTILGMLPLALAAGEGMEMQQPMALAIIYGMSISTVVTLVFIPVLYLLVDKFRYRHMLKKHHEKKQIKKSKKALKGKKSEEDAETVN